ncbi:MAG: hypothetical protein E6I82_08080, partial [Chloroflexi bacterium]
MGRCGGGRARSGQESAGDPGRGAWTRGVPQPGCGSPARDRGVARRVISLPAYDTNLFTRGISQADFSRLLNDPDKPLLNRAIAGQYAPGSTFKMVTATAGLQEGKITAETLLACPPYINVNGWIYHNWASYSLGRMNVARALATSCDTFFYQVASMVGDVTLA